MGRVKSGLGSYVSSLLVHRKIVTATVNSFWSTLKHTWLLSEIVYIL